MGKKKEKAKKINSKRERYSKFRKEKPAAMSIAMPDLSDDQTKQKRNDEQKIDSYWRYFRRRPERFVLERKAKSKR